jgi:aquaporin Z
VQASNIAISTRHAALAAVASHWPECLMEGVALATFMMSACAFGILLLPVAGFLGRVMGGIAMGITAVAIICSPFGKRSGAHMNPALTLTFWSLGKIAAWDAVFYVLAQFAGGAAGVLISSWIFGAALTRVNYVATVPGPGGAWLAFAAEFAISFLLVTAVLYASNSPRLMRFTPLIAGSLVALYIAIESPISGMSMNPARTFGSAAASGIWTAIWIYFLAPPLAMLAAGQLYRRTRGVHRVFCAKFHHYNDQRCIFRCNYGAIHEQ